MTDQEKDKLIVETLGEHHPDMIFPECICKICGKRQMEHSVPYYLDNWEGLGWIWGLAQKMEWWDEFLNFLWHKEYPKTFCPCMDDGIPVKYIPPTRFRDALAEFLERRKG